MGESARDGSPSERRVRERIAVAWPGTLVYEGGEELCAVIDFSPRGARVSASNAAPINRPLTLRLSENGEFLGRIVWRRPGCMGLRFQHLEPEALATRAEHASPIRLIA